MRIRHALATGALAAALVGCQGHPPVVTNGEQEIGTVVCEAPTEDSSIRACVEVGAFEPASRYDYTHGAWVKVPADMLYANGNRPPTGAELAGQLTARQLSDLPDAERQAYVARHGHPTPPAGYVWAEDHTLVPDSFYR
jgi:hypothetical protein